MKKIALALALAAALMTGTARGEVMNLKVVTDASPDYSDMDSLIHSVTSKWKTPKEKCWAMFYWVHIARRQTQPMKLHGFALTDPIRQFNDYGYTMCSTVSGINQSIWEHMGLKHKYWDISMHTVSEVEYEGSWHMYDNSLSALYTLCDGVTLAPVDKIGATMGCSASGGKEEPGHIAKYHCITATSTRGFLIGGDTPRSLQSEYKCFNPKGLKYRYYYYDWFNGHRYILNLKDGEVYTRYYHKMGDTPDFYVPNPNGIPGGKDPESTNKRYRIRGNGQWTFKPDLSAGGWKGAVYDAKNVKAARGGGLAAAGDGAEAIFRIQSANVTTGQVIKAAVTRKGGAASLSISTDNGIHWKEVWKAEADGGSKAEVKLRNEVNGTYEILIKAAMSGDATLKSLEVDTTTMVNSKTQPKFNLGKNVVYVGTGDQTDSIVFWPELRGDGYKRHIAEEKNMGCQAAGARNLSYRGVLFPRVANEDAYIVYRIDAPRDITSVTYGGRYFNRTPGGEIEVYYSTDNKEWTSTYKLTDIKPPWDTIHYDTVDIPAGNKRVYVKYLLRAKHAGIGHTAIYALHIEADHKPVDPAFKPVEVTFAWKEPQADRSVVERSHTQLVTKVPFKYEVNVGGADHPVMESLKVNLKGAAGDVKYGYSDGKDAGGDKYRHQWVTFGRNLAVGKKYTCDPVSSVTNWDSGDPEGTKLTDGVVGPPYAGGTSYSSGAIWKNGETVTIDVDLEKEEECASFGLNMHGFPTWDALKGEVKDTVEVFVSPDGKQYRSLGMLRTDMRWRDIPINRMVVDDEHMKAVTHRLIPEKPVIARYVRFKAVSKRFMDITEIEVLDSLNYKPFDIGIAMPDEK